MVAKIESAIGCHKADCDTFLAKKLDELLFLVGVDDGPDIINDTCPLIFADPVSIDLS